MSIRLQMKLEEAVNFVLREHLTNDGMFAKKKYFLFSAKIRSIFVKNFNQFHQKLEQFVKRELHLVVFIIKIC